MKHDSLLSIKSCKPFIYTMTMIAFSAVLILSCKNNLDSNMESVIIALKAAKNNRPELEHVLNHYRGDTLKYRAACFLIANMPGHYSFTGEEATVFHRKVDSLLAITPINNMYHDSRKINKAIDSLADLHPWKNFRIVPDIEAVSSNFLINNIEQSFDLWYNKPWAKHLDFDNFCEYLLPYTINNHYVLEDWRPKVAAQIDSSIMAKLDLFRLSSELKHSAYWAAETINSYLMDKMDGDNSPEVPSPVRQISVQTLIPYGGCEHYCDIAMLTMRSIGIPIITDFTPQWPFRSWGHTWNIVPAHNGKNIPFGGCTEKLGTIHKVEQKMAKVYRKTYAADKELIRMNQIEKNVPTLFRNIFMKDVSTEYMKTFDISIPVGKGGKHEYAYLSVFDNRNWIPVCYGKKRGNKFTFKEIGGGIAYLPVLQTENELVPFSAPFILDINGNMRHMRVNTDSVQETILERKFFLSQRTHMYVGRLIGGRLEAANKKDFSDAVLLHTIDKWSILPDSITVTTSVPYRYWRYVSPKDGLCNIAELQFFEMDGTQKKGVIIGTDEAYYPDDSSSHKQAAFDDDPLTYFDASRQAEQPWVGMDFGKPTTIHIIRYIPRNDDNNIRPDDTYELFYWGDGQWISLGKKISEGVSLYYDNVPQNALLLLRNLSRGKEERIFTYENDEQIWW